MRGTPCRRRASRRLQTLLFSGSSGYATFDAVAFSPESGRWPAPPNHCHDVLPMFRRAGSRSNPYGSYAASSCNTLLERARRTVLTWNGVKFGCLARICAISPAT